MMEAYQFLRIGITDSTEVSGYNSYSDWIENPVYRAGKSGAMPEVFVSLGDNAAGLADCPFGRLPCHWLNITLKNFPLGNYEYVCWLAFYGDGSTGGYDFDWVYPKHEKYEYLRYLGTQHSEHGIAHDGDDVATYQSNCLYNFGDRFRFAPSVGLRDVDFEYMSWPYVSEELEEYRARTRYTVTGTVAVEGWDSWEDYLAGISHPSYAKEGVPSSQVGPAIDSLHRECAEINIEDGLCDAVSITLSEVPAGEYLLMCFEIGDEHGEAYLVDARAVVHDGRDSTGFTGCATQHVVLGLWSDDLSQEQLVAESGLVATGSDGGQDATQESGEQDKSRGESPVDGTEARMPGRPRDLRLVFVDEDGAGVGGDEFVIGWEAPFAGDGGAIRDYVVSVSRPSVPDLWFVSWLGSLLGPVEESFSTSRTSMRFEGAHSATYTVSVAARNGNGVGPAITGEIRTRRGPWTCAVDPGQRKYELTTTGGWGWPWKVGSVTRIKALQDFMTVHGLRVSKGVLGGQVDGAHNLSQEGCSWIAYGASVSDNAAVSGDAVVAGNARLEDDARVADAAVVSGNAKLYDNAEVYGNARVAGSARIDDRAEVYDSAEVSGSAHIYDSAHVFESAKVSGRGRVYHGAKVYGRAEVSGDADVHGDDDRRNAELRIEDGQFKYLDSAEVSGDAVIKGDARVHGSAIVYGEVEFSGDVNIDEGEYDGDVEYLRGAAGLVRAIHEDNAALFRKCTRRAQWTEREVRQAARHVVEAMVFGETTSVDHQVSSIIRDECLKWEAIVELLRDVAPNGAELALQYGLQLLRAANLSRMTQTILDFADGLNDIRDLINARDYIETASEKLAVSSGESLRLQLMNGSLRAIEDDRIRFTEVDGDIRIQGQLRDGSWRYF